VRDLKTIYVLFITSNVHPKMNLLSNFTFMKYVLLTFLYDDSIFSVSSAMIRTYHLSAVSQARSSKFNFCAMV